MNTVIKAENIGKRYYLNQKNGSRLRQIIRSLSANEMPSKQAFWALKDLTFTIHEGESVGIIGLNGAGKSTLLKILGNVTKPTKGSIKIFGRIGALIDLGAGFHPELSGRENIFLTGSILGIKKREIASKLEDIISFAELEQFIDTPVKRYSSGMFVRLGFAVAVHIIPDILIVDEVLAVGDLSFQKKCFDWIHNYLISGKTLVLVSHQMHHVENVCNRVLYIKEGQIVFDGPSDQAISLYLGDATSNVSNIGKRVFQGYRTRLSEFDVLGLYLLSPDNTPTKTVTLDQPLNILIDFHSISRIFKPKVELAFNCKGIRIGQANTVSDKVIPDFLEGKGIITFRWPRCFLTPNYYTIDFYVSDSRTGADIFVWNNALSFRVKAPDGFRIASGNPGMVRIPGNWSFQVKS
jgi:lipopolysaccharide transport system ATP-binding protein